MPPSRAMSTFTALSVPSRTVNLVTEPTGGEDGVEEDGILGQQAAPPPL